MRVTTTSGAVLCTVLKIAHDDVDDVSLALPQTFRRVELLIENPRQRMPVGQVEIGKPRHRDVEIDGVDIFPEYAGILPLYEQGADCPQQRRVERLHRRRLLEMPRKMNVLDAHQANERRRAN